MAFDILMDTDLIRKNLDDGYRLTYGGYDYLALHSLTNSDSVLQLGSTMGVGKESDILSVTSPAPDASDGQVEAVLKIHRLGRISFRSVSNNRDYLGKRSHTSWQYLSRLSAQKEYSAMRVLRDAGFNVPRPIAHSRHAIVMSLVPGMPLRAVPLGAFGRSRVEQDKRVSSLYGELMEILLEFAERGIIHGDMNEFNIMLGELQTEQRVFSDVDEEAYEQTAALEKAQKDISSDNSLADTVGGVESETLMLHDMDSDAEMTPYIIDFPQITSMSHPQAAEYFDRDVNGIKAFFRKRYHFECDNPGPTFEEAQARLETASSRGVRRLDVQTQAAGFSKKAATQLEGYYAGGVGKYEDTEIDLINGNKFDVDVDTDMDNELSSFKALAVREDVKTKLSTGWSI